MKKFIIFFLITVFAYSVNAQYIPEPKPEIDCKATLESWDNPPNCYCPCDTCHPVCKELEPQPEIDYNNKHHNSQWLIYAQNDTQTQPGEQVFICYWRAECFRGSGHAITDGTTFGSFYNVNEAKEECMRDAKRNTQGYGGFCDIKCDCWLSGSEPVYIPQ